MILAMTMTETMMETKTTLVCTDIPANQYVISDYQLAMCDPVDNETDNN